MIPKMYDNIFNGSSPFIGNALMRDWLRESQSKGKQWMTTGQLSAALALLIGDGHNQEHVAIINPSVMGRIQWAFNDYMSFKTNKCEMDDLLQNTPESPERDALLKDQKVLYEASKSKYLFTFNQFVLDFFRSEKYRNIMKKKLVMFLVNQDNNHWVATYVFNPGCIVEDISLNEVSGQRKLRCCFYRYCGLHQEGDTTISNHCGIIWFLNTVYNFGLKKKMSSGIHEKLKYQMGCHLGHTTKHY